MDEVTPERITLAREARGLTQKALAEIASITQGYLSRVENGRHEPSDEFIEAISKALGYPDSFFRKSVSIQRLPVSFYRKRKSLSQKYVNTVEARANIMMDHLKVLLKSVDPLDDALPLFDMDEPHRLPDQYARELRLSWNVPRGPLGNLVRLLESKGAVVIPFDFGTKKIDALSLRPDENLPPVIFVSKDIPGDRMRFSLAHELGHLVLHQLPQPLDINLEDEADAFASEFLMPADEIRPQLRHLKMARLGDLKARWKVAMSALVYRAKTLGCISKTQAKYFFMNLGRLGYRTVEPIPIPREQPKALQYFIDFHLNDLEYKEIDLSASLHMKLSEFRKEYLGMTQSLRVVDGCSLS